MNRLPRLLLSIVLLMVLNYQAQSQEIRPTDDEKALKITVNNLDVIFTGKYTNMYGTYKIRLESIQVKKGNQLLQEIKGLDFKTTLMGNDFLTDFNKDGLQDLKIRKSWSYGGLYECFIFNPNNQKFERNSLLSGLRGLRVGEKFIISEKTTLYAHMQSSSITEYYKYDSKTRSFHHVKTTRYRSDSNPNKPRKPDLNKMLKKGKKKKN